LPAGESSMALIPEPPMSMESVTGRAACDEAPGARAAIRAGFGIITTEF